MSVPVAPVVQAVVDALKAATGRPAGFGAIPVDATGTEVAPPLFIVYPVLASHSTQSLGDSDRQAWITVQITSVGLRPDQAAVLRDKAEAVLLDRTGDDWTTPLNPAGCVVTGRALADGTLGDGGGSETSTNALRVALYVTRR